jgi:hypothetical protein
LVFDAAAFEDLAWWVEQDRRQALRIIRLIRDVQRDPFRGLGQPEPLSMTWPGVGLDGSMPSIVWCMKSSKTKSEFWRVGIITD